MLKRRRHRSRAVIALLLGLAVLAGAAGYARLSRQFHAPGPASAAVRIKVESGDSIRAVLGRLASLGALDHPREVEWYLRLHRSVPRIEIGTYELPPHASPADIIRRFEQWRVVLDQITVVEGATFADFRRELDAQPEIEH